MKAKFIKTIGNCSYKGYSFSLYENRDGSATLRPEKFSRQLSRKHFINFPSVGFATDYLDSKKKEYELTDVGLILFLVNQFLVDNDKNWDENDIVEKMLA